MEIPETLIPPLMRSKKLITLRLQEKVRDLNKPGLTLTTKATLLTEILTLQWVLGMSNWDTDPQHTPTLSKETPTCH